MDTRRPYHVASAGKSRRQARSTSSPSQELYSGAGMSFGPSMDLEAGKTKFQSMHACNHPEANVAMCKDGLPHTPQDRSGV